VGKAERGLPERHSYKERKSKLEKRKWKEIVEGEARLASRIEAWPAERNWKLEKGKWGLLAAGFAGSGRASLFYFPFANFNFLKLAGNDVICR